MGVRDMPSRFVRRPTHELAFAAVIRQVRIEAGRTKPMSPRRLVSQCHAVARAEQGIRRISLGEAAAIAESLGHSLDELVKVSDAAKFKPPPMGRPRCLSPVSRCSRRQFAGLVHRERIGWFPVSVRRLSGTLSARFHELPQDLRVSGCLVCLELKVRRRPRLGQ